MQWNLRGTYFEACSCDAACPCAFMSAPSKGECTLMVGWHIDQGLYGDTRLDGLNVAMAAYSPGDMMKTPWQTALYMDERAAPPQREALTQIFTGKAGGHPERFAAHFGEVLGIKSAPIEFTGERKHQALRIPNVAVAEIEDLTGEEGGAVAISGRPWSFAPGQPSVVARSQRLDYDDYDFHWHISGENGFHSPFQYQA